MAAMQGNPQLWHFKRCAVIVAHPDDETLWTGGTILLHPDSKWHIITLCRAGDDDRAPKFARALEALGASGAMGDLDDGPEQNPLKTNDVQQTILDLLPCDRFDLVLTHGRWGEYKYHRRHEEVAHAVMALRESGRLLTPELRLFAYEDKGGKTLPRAVRDADSFLELPQNIWQKKYEIITKIYGFTDTSFEATTTPKQEAFWVFRDTSKTNLV
ncbi:MAG: PIG-L family deacetylase [Sedimentisphaerales bacterium]|nr:PIG-L family deacetylase [Sedimentisphaerales bacterium]